MRRLRSGAPAASPSAAEATAPRLRIVPDVPMTRSKPGPRDLIEVLADLRVDVARQLALVARLPAGSVLTNRSVSRITPSLKLRPSSMADPAPRVTSTLPPPMSMTTATSPGHADAVDRGQMDESRLFGAGDDPRSDPGLLGDRLEKLAAVLRLARRARRDRDDLVDPVRFGQPPEFRQHLERGVHGLRRERAAVQPARAQPDHFLFPVDDFEGQVGADLDHDHVDGIGADVDGGQSHGPVL